MGLLDFPSCFWLCANWQLAWRTKLEMHISFFATLQFASHISHASATTSEVTHSKVSPWKLGKWENFLSHAPICTVTIKRPWILSPVTSIPSDSVWNSLPFYVTYWFSCVSFYRKNYKINHGAFISEWNMIAKVFQISASEDA